MPHDLSYLAVTDPFAAGSEVVVELAGEHGSLQKRLRALEDTGVRLARVGEGLPHVKFDVEQPPRAPGLHETRIVALQLWKMCATS